MPSAPTLDALTSSGDWEAKAIAAVQALMAAATSSPLGLIVAPMYSAMGVMATARPAPSSGVPRQRRSDVTASASMAAASPPLTNRAP
jgi:hypothetical protein